MTLPAADALMGIFGYERMTEMDWSKIDTAPKDGTAIDIWCIPPDGCDFKPTNGGIRLTDVFWHTADEKFPHTGWVRVCDDGGWDIVESPPISNFGLPEWKPVYWMLVPKPPTELPDESSGR